MLKQLKFLILIQNIIFLSILDAKPIRPNQKELSNHPFLDTLLLQVNQWHTGNEDKNSDIFRNSVNFIN